MFTKQPKSSLSLGLLTSNREGQSKKILEIYIYIFLKIWQKGPRVMCAHHIKGLPPPTKHYPHISSRSSPDIPYSSKKPSSKAVYTRCRCCFQERKKNPSFYVRNTKFLPLTAVIDGRKESVICRNCFSGGKTCNLCAEIAENLTFATVFAGKNMSLNCIQQEKYTSIFCAIKRIFLQFILQLHIFIQLQNFTSMRLHFISASWW